MLEKLALTKKLLKELELPLTVKSVRKHHNLWWMNPRNRDSIQSYRLTDAGHTMMVEHLSVKSYKINFPTNLELSSKMILNMDRYLNGPYYLQPKYIVVFKEKMAVELILYEGDLEKYVRAKMMSQNNNTTTP